MVNRPSNPEAFQVSCPECRHRAGMLTASTEVGSFYRCQKCEYTWQVQTGQRENPEPSGQPSQTAIHEPDLEVRARELVMEAMAYGGEMWTHMTPGTIETLVKAVAGDLRNPRQEGTRPDPSSKRRIRRD